MFGTDLGEEHRRVAGAFNLDVVAMARIVTDGIEASFLPAKRKRELAVEVAVHRDRALAHG